MSGPGVIETLVVEDWLQELLAGDSALRRILGPGDHVGRRSVAGRAGNRTVVLYSPQVPARDIRGIGLARIMAECRYLVRAVGLPPDHDVVVAAARRGDELLHGASGPAPGGQIVIATREESVSYADPQGWEVLGGLYRIYAQ